MTISKDNGLGVGQSWNDVTASRATNVTYTNTTGKTILITGYLSCTTANNFETRVNGLTMTFESSVLNGVTPFFIAVKPNETYLINPGGLNFNLSKWWELR